MVFSLPPLPYEPDALHPHITKQTIGFHYGKHHAGYVANLNRLINRSEMGEASLEAIITDAGPGELFNNAAQIWNHTFYWNSMRPNGGGDPSARFQRALADDFGSVNAFKQRFAAAAAAKFGSGWTWLVHSNNGLSVINTDDAETPLADNMTPLVTIDVWEHAYYLDYQNSRKEYVQAFMQHLINWEFAEANYNAVGG